MTNAETPLTPLEELLVAAAHAPDDATVSARFTAAVLDAWVGVPGLTGDRPDQFTPLTITDRDDRRFGVAFTQSARYDTFAEAMEFTEDQFSVHGVEGRALFGMLVRNNLPLLLNPHNDYGKEFAVAEMSDLLAGWGRGRRDGSSSRTRRSPWAPPRSSRTDSSTGCRRTSRDWAASSPRRWPG